MIESNSVEANDSLLANIERIRETFWTPNAVLFFSPTKQLLTLHKKQIPPSAIKVADYVFYDVKWGVNLIDAHETVLALCLDECKEVPSMLALGFARVWRINEGLGLLAIKSATVVERDTSSLIQSYARTSNLIHLANVTEFQRQTWFNSLRLHANAYNVSLEEWPTPTCKVVETEWTAWANILMTDWGIKCYK